MIEENKLDECKDLDFFHKQVTNALRVPASYLRKELGLEEPTAKPPFPVYEVSMEELELHAKKFDEDRRKAQREAARLHHEKWEKERHAKDLAKLRSSLDKSGLEGKYFAQEQIPGPGNSTFVKWLNTGTLILSTWDSDLNRWVVPIRSGVVTLVKPAAVVSTVNIDAEVPYLTTAGEYFTFDIPVVTATPDIVEFTVNIDTEVSSPEEDAYERAMRILG